MVIVIPGPGRQKGFLRHCKRELYTFTKLSLINTIRCRFVSYLKQEHAIRI